jgi:hypothetical protein
MQSSSSIFVALQGQLGAGTVLLNCRSLSLLDSKNALFGPEDVLELIAQA